MPPNHARMPSGDVQPTIAVRPLTEADWAGLRDLRLRALADSPAAFSSTLAREEAFDEAMWRMRASTRTTFVALIDGARMIGLAGGAPSGTGESSERDVVSVWVDPVMRRLGAAGMLLTTVGDWARAQGASTLCLWVMEGNASAIAAYERAGFALTGARQLLRPGDSRVEVRMARPL